MMRVLLLLAIAGAALAQAQGKGGGVGGQPEARSIAERVAAVRDAELFVEHVAPGKARVYVAPVWRRDAQGKLADISVRWSARDGGGQMAAGAGVAAEVSAAGVLDVGYRRGRGVTLEPLHGYAQELEPTASGVKETVLVPERGDWTGTLSWRVTVRGLQGETDGEQVLWSTPAGEPVLVCPPIVAWDASGARTGGTYSLDGDTLTVALDPAWVDDPARVWPVYVDPTVDSATATAAAASSYDTGAYDEYNDCWLKFTLPDISGGTCTAATLHLYCLSTDGSANPATVSVYVSQNTSWTSSSSIGTLNGLTGWSTALDSGSSFSGSTAYELDVTGDSGEGLVKAYNDSASAVSVRLNAGLGNGDTKDSVTNSFDLGDTDHAYYNFAGPSHATTAYRPYIEVTYTAGGGSTFYDAGVTQNGQTN